MTPIHKQISVVDNEATGKAMRKARVSSGLSLRCVAGRLKVSVSYASDLERGRRNWSDDLVEAFQKALQK